MHVCSQNYDSSQRFQRSIHSKKNGTSRFGRSRLNHNERLVAVLLGIPLVADDGPGACSNSATKQCSFNPTAGLMADDAAQGSTRQTADHGALLGVRTGRSLTVRKSKRDDSGCDG